MLAGLISRRPWVQIPPPPRVTDLFDIFAGQRPKVARNNDDFAYAVAMSDGLSDALADRPFRLPRDAGAGSKEGYAEGWAKGKESLA